VTEDELYAGACDRYHRACDARGVSPAVPSRADSGIEAGAFVLRSKYRELARFKLKNVQRHAPETKGAAA
jgi:hypothetical protein